MPLWLRRLLFMLPVLALIAAAWAIHGFLGAHDYDALKDSIAAVSLPRVLAALALTALSFAILTLYDVLAARYAKAALTTARIAGSAPLVYAFSNSLGVSMLTSAALRLRLYQSAGAGAVATMTAFSTLTLWLGPIALLPLALAALAFPAWLIVLAGLAAAGILIGLLTAPLWWRRPLVVGGAAIAPPSPAMAVGQIALSVADWSVAALVLAVLVPGDIVSPERLVAAFLAAQLLGLVSHLPGGIGVFEATVVALAGGGGDAAAALAGPLLAYRVIYYMAPLALAAAALLARETWERRAVLQGAGRRLLPGLGLVTPSLMGAAAFAAGLVLLVSAVTPGIGERLAFLDDFLPIEVIELSHLLSVLAGIALLFLARGLVRRHRPAFVVTLIVLGVGIVTSLLKGVDYEEALIAAAALALLWQVRGLFHRRAAIFDLALTPVYAVAIAAALALSVWLGFFVFRDVPYDPALLTTADLDNDAGRFLRALVAGGAFVFALLSIYFLGRGPQRRQTRVSPAELLSIAPALAAAPDTYAQLALLGDKALVQDDGGPGFIMYGTGGRSWIAMGDPVAREAATKRALLWRFLELCDSHDTWPVFYQATPEALPLYLDAGLAVNKLGEEALVDLKTFTLDGPKMSGLRQSVRAAERKGLSFEIVPAADLAPHLPAMRAVSDSWLAAKNVREKGFSLGRFDEAYVSHFPAALVHRKEDRGLVAFANLWLGADKAELSVDLMRATPDAPGGHMDFLFANLMRWGQAEGFGRFNLGMAPMSGLEAHRLAPLWHRAGSYVFSHMESFYNFKGLRQYKQKFMPEWAPRYLVSPGGAPLPQILVEVSALIAGGLMGVMRK